MYPSPYLHRHTDKKRMTTLIFALILWACLPGIAAAQMQRTPPPDAEKRSCIQTVDGFAYLSEDMTLSDTRAAAFSNAKRQALEMAKTYVTSKTKVKNFTTEYDMIWSESEGMVTVLEQKDFGIENNTRYHIWIKAEVEYSLKAKKPVVEEPVETTAQAPLTVSVWTDKKTYKEGERIHVHIRGNRDFYARIVDITSTGDIIQLLPNDYRQINYFKKDVVYNIPNDEDGFILTATPPFGQDKIIVYAGEFPMKDLHMESLGNGLNKYNGSQKTLGTETRENSSLVVPENSEFKGAEFYEATWIMTTTPK